MQLAHRISWMLRFGDIPEGICVCHACDNPSCVNYEHLFIGSHTDNMRDMQAKKRAADTSRERNGRTKLSGEEVSEIRKLYATGKFRQQDLAEIYGVNQTNIGFIVRQETWR